MKTIAVAKVALLLLVVGCGADRSSPGEAEPEGQAGSGGTGAVAADGYAGAGESFPVGGAGGIGAVRGPYWSTGGASAPFEISCRFRGIDYEAGEAIPSIDGCNVCTCGAHGIECGDRPCRGQASADGDPRDGDPYIACESSEDCPNVDCACADEDGDLECDEHCASYGCESGVCVDIASRPCSPDDTSACLENEFCAYSLDDACGAASRGTCMLIFNERRCSQDESPACGCDGVQYRNACFVIAAGQSVAQATVCGAGGAGGGAGGQ